MIARILIISGDVQGVSYRYFARTEAKKVGLSGWIKNEHDGTVKALVQGEEDSVESFIAWAEEGSPMADVQNVTVEEAEINDDFKGFEVK